jgi:hypothetical protein
MPSPQRERVLGVKRGEVPRLADVLAEIDGLRAEVAELLAAGRTPLPPEPDWALLGEWSVSAHRSHWGWG